MSAGLAACATSHSLPEAAGFKASEIATSSFKIASLQRLTNPAAPIVIYIEGDGMAWKSKGSRSHNPTPRNAVGMNLALIDPAPNVVYLARPCQFVAQDPLCTPSVWTDDRFSEKAIEAMHDAVRAIAPEDRPVHLVGYSGGAAIAVHLAARREHVLSLRTIAGNLSVHALNEHHKVSPMPSALDPLEIAPKVKNIPQAHWTSARDTIVPPFVARDFIAALGEAPNAKMIEAPSATHEKGWEDVWRGECGAEP